jgi:hypothetical protein
VQVLEISLQLLPVLLLRDSIHAYRSILPTAAIGPLQGWHIDQMRQRVEPSFGFALRSATTFNSSGDMFSNVDALAMVPS